MRFIQSFGIFRNLFWICLLAVLLFASGPLHAAVPSVSVVGRITAVHTVERVVAIDGTRYTLAPQAEIYRETDQGVQAMNMTDLRIGQSIAVEISDELILSVRILE